MSHSAIEGEASEEEQSDSSDADSIADTLITNTSVMTEVMESVTDDDLEAMSDEDLVELRTELKELETAVEHVRKDQADEELEERVDVGDRLFGLKRVQSHNKYVKDDPGAVITRAASAGIDWTQFVEINASDLADVAPDIAEIGKYEYTYLL